MDVAAKLGFTSYDRISLWENGLAFPSVTNLFRLAALYAIPTEELYREMYEVVKNEISGHKNKIEQLPAAPAE